MGLPTIQFVQADNQRDAARALHDVNAAILLDDYSALRLVLQELNREVMQKIAHNASGICSGQGAISVANELFNQSRKANAHLGTIAKYKR